MALSRVESKLSEEGEAVGVVGDETCAVTGEEVVKIRRLTSKANRQDDRKASNNPPKNCESMAEKRIHRLVVMVLALIGKEFEVEVFDCFIKNIQLFSVT